MSSPPHVTLLCKDLFFTSQLQGPVKRLGGTCRVALSERGCREALQQTPADWLIVDLELPFEDLAGLVQAAGPMCRTVGFGPHLRTELFAQAEAAGVRHILTRGEISRGLEPLLVQGSSAD